MVVRAGPCGDEEGTLPHALPGSRGVDRFAQQRLEAGDRRGRSLRDVPRPSRGRSARSRLRRRRRRRGPSASASDASTSWPARSRRAAAPCPTIDTSFGRTPQAVVTAMRACLNDRRALVSATRRSHATASSAPPPMAGPGSAAMTGTRSWRDARRIRAGPGRRCGRRRPGSSPCAARAGRRRRRTSRRRRSARPPEVGDRVAAASIAAMQNVEGREVERVSHFGPVDRPERDVSLAVDAETVLLRPPGRRGLHPPFIPARRRGGGGDHAARSQAREAPLVVERQLAPALSAARKVALGVRR